MIEKTVLLLMLALAVIIVFSKNIRYAVIYLGMFSLLCAMLFVIYGASDVAIAEAVIGGGLSTILYLVAIKQIDHFTIHVITGNLEGESDDSTKEIEAVLHEIQVLLRTRHVSCIIKYYETDLMRIEENGEADMVLHREGKTIRLCGVSQELNLDLIEELLGSRNFERCNFYRFPALSETEAR